MLPAISSLPCSVLHFYTYFALFMKQKTVSYIQACMLPMMYIMHKYTMEGSHTFDISTLYMFRKLRMCNAHKMATTTCGNVCEGHLKGCSFTVMMSLFQ